MPKKKEHPQPETLGEAVTRLDFAMNEIKAVRQWVASLLEKVGTGALSRLWGVSRGTLTKYSGRGVETIKPEFLQGYLQIMKENLPGGELPADPSNLRDPRGRKKK